VPCHEDVLHQPFLASSDNVGQVTQTVIKLVWELVFLFYMKRLRAFYTKRKLLISCCITVTHF